MSALVHFSSSIPALPSVHWLPPSPFSHPYHSRSSTTRCLRTAHGSHFCCKTVRRCCPAECLNEMPLLVTLPNTANFFSSPGGDRRRQKVCRALWSRPFGSIPWVHHGVSYGYPMALSGLILGYPMGILGYPRVSYAIWLNQHFGSTIQS